MADLIQGYFTPESETLLSEIIDKAIDKDKVPAWLEMIDKPVGKVVVQILDNKLLENLPTDEEGENLYAEEVNQIVTHVHDAFVNENKASWALAASLATNIVFAIAPFEKWITQEGEDAAKGMVMMLLTWLLGGGNA